MLQINELNVSYITKRHSIKALGPIDLEINSGEIYALVGPSGCGKSTLLNVLGGIIKEYTGNVLLKGEKLNPKSHDIGMIPQNFGLLPWKNVEQNYLAPFKIKKRKIDSKTNKRIAYILKKLEIESLGGRYPNELSGGQSQRVAIARAFIMNPDILLMDEPFSALDALTREEAQELFIDIWSQYKITTVFVTHNIEEAIYMGKKIIIMSHCPGTIVEIIDNPLFNSCNIREKNEYIEMAGHIRGIVKKRWKL